MGQPSTITTKLGGTQVEGVRDLIGIRLKAIFDSDKGDASIDPLTLNFTGQANKKLLELHALNPLEAPDIEFQMDTNDDNESMIYGVDFRTMKFMSDEETQCEIFADSSTTFEKEADGLTMQSLVDKGVLTDSDFRDVPYVIENRKKFLEFLVLQLQLVQTSKSIFDEVFKQINIVSDIASGAWFTTVVAAVVAGINLTVSTIHLVFLTIRFVQILSDIKELLFPPVRYHRGINLFDYLTKASGHLNKTLDLGVIAPIVKQITLLGSKRDEVGRKSAGSFLSALDTLLELESKPGSGLLKPNNFGYTFGEAIRLTKKMFNGKSGINGPTYNLKTKNDSFWTNAPSMILPDVLIEQALGYSNGFSKLNYEELVTRYFVEYERDRSDYFTLTDTNNQMSEVIFDATVSNPARRLLRGETTVKIPYALCVRKPEYDGLFAKTFKELQKGLNSFNKTLEKIKKEFADLNAVPIPPLPAFVEKSFVKEGALRMENHWFETPKIVLQDEVTGRIPENFATIIGADALNINFHSWNFPAPGFKNPSAPLESNQKRNFFEVKIPFGLKDWIQTSTNRHFLSPTFGPGEFTSIDFQGNDDFATCNFYIFENYAPDLTGELAIIGAE